MNEQTKKLTEEEVESEQPEIREVQTKKLVEEAESAPTATPVAGVTDDDRLMALLAYVVPVVVPAIILLKTELKERAYQKYHAVQSLGLSVVSIAFWIVLTVITGAMSALCCPLACVTGLLYFAPLIAMAYYGYRAHEMQDFDIPYLTEFMLQNGWL